MVREYIEGRSLRDLLNARGPLPVDEALDIALVLADFGIPLRPRGPATHAQPPRERNRQFGLHPRPSRVRGERGDARIDVYALVGRVPYPSEDAFEAMRQKTATEPPLVPRVHRTSRRRSRQS